MNWSESLVWQVSVAETAQKDIGRLDKQNQAKIIRFLRERIEGCADPRQTGKALKGDLGDLWRYRLGDYRIICAIQDSVVTVLVVRVRLRREVYRKSL